MDDGPREKDVDDGSYSSTGDRSVLQHSSTASKTTKGRGRGQFEVETECRVKDTSM